MRTAPLLVLALAVGCGPAEPIGYAYFDVVEGAVGEAHVGTVVATFAETPRPEPSRLEPSPECVVTDLGECHLVECPSHPMRWDREAPSTGGELTAGDVVVAIDGAPVALRAGPGGTYDGELPAIATGAVLTFAATGDVVPPFSLDVVAPGRPALALPERIEPGRDLVIGWTPGEGDPDLEISIDSQSVSFGSASASLRCTPPARRGQLVVPRALLDRIDAVDPGTSFFVSGTHRRVVEVEENGMVIAISVEESVTWATIAR